MLTLLRGSAWVAAVAGPAAATRDPVLLTRRPLDRATGLRLVVADARPFVLEVDSGRITRITGTDAPATMVAVAGRGAVLVERIRRNGAVHAVGRRGDRIALDPGSLAQLPGTRAFVAQAVQPGVDPTTGGSSSSRSVTTARTSSPSGDGGKPGSG